MLNKLSDYTKRRLKYYTVYKKKHRKYTENLQRAGKAIKRNSYKSDC